MATILVVEDDEAIRNLVKMTLEMDGMTVITAGDGAEGIRIVEEHKDAIDLMLLDIMLPNADGYEVLTRIRDRHIAVIFMTAKSSVTDRIFGLKMGADDYITKPFEPMELLAKVNANLRMQERYGAPHRGAFNKIRFAGLEISPSERTVSRGGTEIALTAKEFELFLTLLEHRNQVMTREQLLDSVWGYDFYGGTRTVDMHIGQLRKKLGLYEQLETVYRVGYKLKDEK